MRSGLIKPILVLGCTCLCALVTSAQLIKNSYRFYNNLSVSAPECGIPLVATKAAGGCTAGPVAGSFIMDNLPNCAVQRPVYHSNLNWGLQYPNTQGTVTGTYTIHLYVKTTNWGSRTWVRIIDFSNGLSDAGIYFKVSGTPDHCLDFYPNGIVGACPYFNDASYYLLTFTRNGGTGIIDVYVNNTLFTSYNDAAGMYKGTSGVPIYIYRDDQSVACESGEANFAYLSFTNQYSSKSTVEAVYNDICTIANTFTAADFSLSATSVCSAVTPLTVTYTGDIPAPGTGYSFNWNWDGGTVISGSGIGPYTVSWPTPGTKNISLTVTNNGCASQDTKTKQLLILTNIISNINKSVCAGQSFLGYSKTGIYNDTFRSVNGCDSIRVLNLTISTAINTNISAIICQGESFLGHSTSGVYTDTFLSSSGCDSVRTLQLTVKKPISSIVNYTICEGDNYLGHYVTGTYTDTLKSATGCDSIRTLRLVVTGTPKPDLGPDLILCEGDSLRITPGKFSSYLWQDASAADHFIVKQPGLYSVTVTNACGSGKDEVLLTGKICDIIFPNAFTPDKDGRNDNFRMLNAYNVKDFSLVIYNRWGQKIFESADYTKGWDGTVKGQAAPAGLYVWYAGIIKGNVKKSIKGTVLLVR